MRRKESSQGGFQWRWILDPGRLTLSKRLAGRQVKGSGAIRGRNLCLQEEVFFGWRVSRREEQTRSRLNGGAFGAQQRAAPLHELGCIESTANWVGKTRNAAGNFFVNIVFYNREHKRHCDGQAGDIGGPAATRELSVGTFCDLNHAVDGGISFLLFIDPVSSRGRDDCAGGTYSASTRLALKTV